MDIKVKEVAYHRNGVGGAPFHVVKFRHENKNMLGVVFTEERHVAVFDLDKLGNGEIAFGVNSHRGDVFEDDLRTAIEEDLKKYLRKMGVSESDIEAEVKNEQNRIP